MYIKAYNIEITGIVQAVGFRPYVYNLAKKYKLKGYVKNNSKGVNIYLKGSEYNISQFVNTIKTSPPPLSAITSISILSAPIKNYSTFTIDKSEKSSSEITLISPDIGLCDDCIKDIENPSNIRFSYAFTNCTNCGPRFSIIHSLPYDRNNTSMKEFEMCDNCLKEYNTPTNRRFHSEANNCKKCGPLLQIFDNQKKLLKYDYPIDFTIAQLLQGKIFAIKGLTGFHLVCNGEDAVAIQTLRERKNRPYKPFAIMVKGLEDVKKYCFVNEREAEALISKEKPIVILKQKENCALHDEISPKQNTIGVMLPSTPIQQMLFNSKINVLIMTSANLSGLPLEYENHNAFNNLCHIADFFLLHDRDILIPLDDSIVHVVNDDIIVIRRARGYVPLPFPFKTDIDIFSAGPQMKNTFSFTKNNYIFTSEYIGDLNNFQCQNKYNTIVSHFKKLFKFAPSVIAHDFHPACYTTYYAENIENILKLQIQHHHAHIASCMIENGIFEKVIGVAYDGTGLGYDNTIWGGEFLLSTYESFERIGYLNTVKLPGGDNAIKEPWKMAVSYIYSSYENEEEAKETSYMLFGEKAVLLFNVIKNYNKFMYTSSIGRFFDAAAAIVGINEISSYEGQASSELQALINCFSNASYKYLIKINDDKYIIETNLIIKELIKDKLKNVPPEIMSIKFHNSIINFTAEVCGLISASKKIYKVALSGGVFQNSYLLENLSKKLKEQNLKVYYNKLYPCNDGGISLGQTVIANYLALK